MTPRNPRSGVTLMETMVALLVMAMVAMLLSSGLGGTARSFNRSGDVSVAIDHALARRELRQWIEHALISPAPGDARAIFQGSQTEFAFLTVPPSATFWSGTATLVGLSTTPQISALGLSIDARAELTSSLMVAPLETRLSFQYWGNRSADEEPDWHADWHATAALPDLVRIDFAGLNNPLPPMVVRPGKVWLQSEMSLSSLVPPALPSRP
ncbi:Prokaryotic N-terminal methylation site [Paracoccaceae bacterium]